MSTPSLREKLEKLIPDYECEVLVSRPDGTSYITTNVKLAAEDIEQLLHSELQSQAEKYEAEKVEAVNRTHKFYEKELGMYKKTTQTYMDAAAMNIPSVILCHSCGKKLMEREATLSVDRKQGK